MCLWVIAAVTDRQHLSCPSTLSFSLGPTRLLQLSQCPCNGNFPLNSRSSYPSPLNAVESLAHDGQVLGQLHHGNDDGSSDQGAGWPEQGVEHGDPSVDLCQDGTVHPVCRIHETLNCVLRPETLRNVLNYHVCGCVVLTALWDVEALKEREREKKRYIVLFVFMQYKMRGERLIKLTWPPLLA